MNGLRTGRKQKRFIEGEELTRLKDKFNPKYVTQAALEEIRRDLSENPVWFDGSPEELETPPHANLGLTICRGCWGVYWIEPTRLCYKVNGRGSYHYGCAMGLPQDLK